MSDVPAYYLKKIRAARTGRLEALDLLGQGQEEKLTFLPPDLFDR